MYAPHHYQGTPLTTLFLPDGQCCSVSLPVVDASSPVRGLGADHPLTRALRGHPNLDLRDACQEELALLAWVARTSGAPALADALAGHGRPATDPDALVRVASVIRALGELAAWRALDTTSRQDLALRLVPVDSAVAWRVGALLSSDGVFDARLAARILAQADAVGRAGLLRFLNGDGLGYPGLTPCAMPTDARDTLLAAALDDADAEVRVQALILAHNLGAVAPTRATLEHALTSDDARAREAAVGLLGLVPGPEALRRIAGIAAGEGSWEAAAAVRALGRRADARDALVTLSADPRPEIRRVVERALRLLPHGFGPVGPR